MILNDKVAVVTGSASGIGQATALLFARVGAQVICIDDQPQGDTLDLFKKENLSAHCFKADVASSQEIRSLVLKCEQAFEKVDILFNNAGRSIKSAFEQTTEEAWEQMVGVNLTSCFLCTKHFLPLMKKAGSGSIIHHASVDAILGNPTIAAYTAAKGGIIPLTHVMAHDLGKYGIRVNCISTGGIRTGMTAARGAAYQSRISVTPLQRMGTPEEVAHAALFLACDWSSFINGVNLVVDGGRTTITQGTYHG